MGGFQGITFPSEGGGDAVAFSFWSLLFEAISHLYSKKMYFGCVAQTSHQNANAVSVNLVQEVLQCALGVGFIRN